jgi:AcrR family transcriptional regulator
MPRPRQVTDEQILEMTRRCVLELGPHVPLDTVAVRLGVTAPALLKRFKSRQALILESLRPPADLPFPKEFFRGPDPRVPLAPQLEALLGAVFDFFNEMVPRITALRESGIPHSVIFGGRASPWNGIRALTRWLEAAIRMGMANTETPESAATVMLGSLTARAFTAHWTKHSYSSRSNREYLKDITELFCRALSVSDTSRRRALPRPRSHHNS